VPSRVEGTTLVAALVRAPLHKQPVLYAVALLGSWRMEVERILGEAAATDAREDEQFGEARGEEMPAELSDRRSRIDACVRVDAHAAFAAIAVPSTASSPTDTKPARPHNSSTCVKTSYPELSTYASSLVMLSEELGSPVVWPVGDAAERLAGAAVLASEGELRVRGWVDDMRGERVLLITVAAVTPLGLVEAAKEARTIGASGTQISKTLFPNCSPAQSPIQLRLVQNRKRSVRCSQARDGSGLPRAWAASSSANARPPHPPLRAAKAPGRDPDAPAAHPADAQKNPCPASAPSPASPLARAGRSCLQVAGIAAAPWRHRCWLRSSHS
jgi:hypothetical protein